MTRAIWLVLLAAGIAGLSVAVAAAPTDELPEYRLKAAFVHNFIMFTEWPAATGSVLNICIAGSDPFGSEIDALQGKIVGARTLMVQRKSGGESLKACQVVYFSPSVVDTLPRLLAGLRGLATLTIADSPGAMRQGVALNMAVQRDKVSFEANVTAARSAGLVLSSKLLRLATEVEQ